MKASREYLITKFLETNCKIDNYEIKKIAGDASFRNYYRVFLQNRNLILMDAPPSHEDIKPFVKIDELLINNGFLAPKILAKDFDNGFLLLQDFGDLSFNRVLQNLNGAELQNKELDLYKQATDVLADLHKIEKFDANIPLYDEELLMKEVMLFIEWYLPHIAKYEVTKQQVDEFKRLFSELFSKLSNNRKLVLRDYHADNLFVFDNNVALLDFQDAVLGSGAYDLVSLLEDARRDASDETVKSSISHYLERSGADEKQFMMDYKILSLQRNVKIIGIFSRLAIRDKKEIYLKFLPKMFDYVTIRLHETFLKDIRNLFNNFID